MAWLRLALRLSCDEYGTGRPIVIAHGLFGSRANWRSVARRLAARFRVLCVDLRNHGESPHSPIHDYPSMADDIRALVEEQGDEGVVLLGHSMGGKAAMQLALNSPGSLSALIVVDIAPRAYPSSHARQVLDALLSVDLGSVSSRSDVDARLADFSLDPALRGFLLKGLKRAGNRTWHWKFNLAAIAANWSCLAASVSGEPFQGPTLFLRGQQSDYFRPDDEALVQQVFPLARVACISGAGHWPNVDAPGETVRMIEEFLSP